MYDIRPMGLKEVLSGAFSIFGASFAPLFFSSLLIQVLANLVMLPLNIESEALMKEIESNPAAAMNVDPLLFTAKTFMGYFIVLMLYTLLQGSLSAYIVGKFLGQGIKIREVFGAFMPRATGLLGLSLVVGLATMAGLIAALLLSLVFGAGGSMFGGLLLFLLLAGGLVMAVLIYIRLSLAGTAYIVEKASIRDAIQRSIELAKGMGGRIFLFSLIYMGSIFVFSLILGAMLEPIGSLVVQSLVGAVFAALVYPFYVCGIILIYFSARARKEHFDRDRLLSQFTGQDAG